MPIVSEVKFTILLMLNTAVPVQQLEIWTMYPRAVVAVPVVYRSGEYILCTCSRSSTAVQPYGFSCTSLLGEVKSGIKTVADALKEHPALDHIENTVCDFITAVKQENPMLLPLGFPSDVRAIHQVRKSAVEEMASNMAMHAVNIEQNIEKVATGVNQGFTKAETKLKDGIKSGLGRAKVPLLKMYFAVISLFVVGIFIGSQIGLHVPVVCAVLSAVAAHHLLTDENTSPSSTMKQIWLDQHGRVLSWLIGYDYVMPHTSGSNNVTITTKIWADCITAEHPPVT
jgi:hypothetical protein